MTQDKIQRLDTYLLGLTSNISPSHEQYDFLLNISTRVHDKVISDRFRSRGLEQTKNHTNSKTWENTDYLVKWTPAQAYRLYDKNKNICVYHGEQWGVFNLLDGMKKK